MNAITKAVPPAIAANDDELIRVLQNSLYPGAKADSIRLVLAWCRNTGRDVMKKPIHIVPMWVTDAATGQGAMRDVLMPGIGTYRTDAAGSGQYAGKDEPEFGPDRTSAFDGVSVTYPLWCRVTVKRMVHGVICQFTAKELWLENYAVGKGKKGVNDMWRKRPYGQLAKVAEAQALRMAFPDETGNTNTSEEMDGKAFDGMTIDAKSELPEVQAVTEAKAETRRTYRTLIDETRGMLSACQTTEEVVAVAGMPAVRHALEHAQDHVRMELSNLLADAHERVPVSEDAEMPDEMADA